MKKKIISILIIMLIIAMTTTVFAADINTGKLSAINNPTGVSSLVDMSGKIIGIIYVVAMIVAVCMTLMMGIKYVMASPDEKANLKGRLVPYLIGAALIFGAANILKFIEKISTWIK